MSDEDDEDVENELAATTADPEAMTAAMEPEELAAEDADAEAVEDAAGV